MNGQERWFVEGATALRRSDVVEATRTLEARASGPGNGGRISFHVTENVSVERARLSWARAAYLAAFAALGWWYVFLPHRT